MTSELVDAAARRAIREDLERTLVVEAAAGTGKTTELVQRIVAIVECGRGSLASLIAVTFTEKAAGEMKLRIRTELDRALTRAVEGSPARERLRRALSELEAAKIGTIHALCSDLLREHPVEARVDPAFEVADEQRARRLKARVFDAWFERALEAPPAGTRRVLRRRLVNDRGEGARAELFAAFSRLVETRDFDGPYRRDPFDRPAALDAVLEELRALAAVGRKSRQANDPLKKSLAKLDERLRRAHGLDHDALEELLRSLVRDREVFNETKGRGDFFAGEIARADVLAARTRAKQSLDACMLHCGADLAACLWHELTPVVREYEAEKAREGVLDFFDLLLYTRNLLAQHADVRRRIQARITHVLVDEFQDTDPVQSEILLLLSADDPSESEPFRVRPIPGKLFVVGDPKQSIYRFRRADVSLYERIKRYLVEQGADVVYLSTSFRSLPAIQSLVNAAFEPLMGGHVERGEAAYVPLSPHRKPRHDQPAIIALPTPEPYSEYGRITKKAIDSKLPDAVAAFLDWLFTKSGFRVLDGGADVQVAPRHVCLLFRRFKAWDGDVTREYVRALEARRIPHVLSGGRSFHAREEVIALRAVLDAIEYPDDALAVYASLRGPFVAFHDETLLAFKTKVGHLHPLGPVAREGLSPEESQVADVLELLAGLHKARNRRPIAQTLSAFLSAVRAHAGIAIWPTGEQALGNVLRVLDFARAYERRGLASSFRGFVEWLDEHAEAGEASDAPVIEESSDGVRIMTVHGAKGLEFPVVVLCDPTAPKRPEYASRYIDPTRKLWAQALCGVEPIELVEQRERVRDHDEAELVRLAYVATTRAKELIVVPTCGDAPIDGWLDVLTQAVYPPPERRRAPVGRGAGSPAFGDDSVARWPLRIERTPDSAVKPGEHVPRAGEHRVVWWDPSRLELTRASTGGLRQADLLRSEQGEADDTQLVEYRAFAEERAQLRERAAVPSLALATVTGRAAQVTTEGVAVLPEVLDLGANRSARPSGSRFGTLVHALFAHGSLRADRAELDALARHLGRTLAATEAEMACAARDVHAALSQPIFERIRAALARGEAWRETPIAVREPDGTLLEGTVDLALREGDRILLIDYKTDTELTGLDVYARQLALYARALAAVHGVVVEALLLRV